MTESAPFVIKMILLSSLERTTTDMRFLVELNSNRFKTSYVLTVSFSLLFKDCSRTSTVVLVRLVKKNPNLFAATTNASSSGDSAWYTIWSGVRSPSGMTVWQTAKIRKNERNCSRSGDVRHCPSVNRLSMKLNDGSIALEDRAGGFPPCLLINACSISVIPSP